ncbi:acyl carrier protein [Zobellia sp. 1_MG-2023]|uniref:acyl carrier protein n=1 Tax=Zobellia sp. 1_MG-2023 TaxID=3062626 RepID=UPI0026E1C754|nr:phosphopantetheine-binding protein [Zobellia sp. 1_MG-2023]MDO6819761.1 phosphopantetheine-binding protein [Zobellia sp. 1_MG-2023]
MKDKIVSYIKNKLASEPIEEIEVDEDLLGSGLVDSIGMVQLILFIETEAAIKVLPEEMTIENFMTINHMLRFIDSKQETDTKQI